MNFAGTAAVLILAVLQTSSVQNTLAKPNAPPNNAAALPDGEFIGLQRLEDDPAEPQAKWFHENTLVVRGTDVILDMDPVVFQKGKKEYSASDGGFLTYRGRLYRKDGQLFVSLRIVESDYILFPIGPNECEPYSQIFLSPVKLLNGVIEINSVHYKPASLPCRAPKGTLTLASRRTRRIHRSPPLHEEFSRPSLQAGETPPFASNSLTRLV